MSVGEDVVGKNVGMGVFSVGDAVGGSILMLGLADGNSLAVTTGLAVGGLVAPTAGPDVGGLDPRSTVGALVTIHVGLGDAVGPTSTGEEVGPVSFPQ